MACFRDHSPINNRQKPSKTQVTTIPPRAKTGAPGGHYWVRLDHDVAGGRAGADACFKHSTDDTPGDRGRLTRSAASGVAPAVRTPVGRGAEGVATLGAP